MKKILLWVLLLCLVFSAFAEAQFGDQSQEVLNLQNSLAKFGYFTEERNGVFGESTRAALCNFQRANGLKESGNADSATLSKLKQDGCVCFEDYLNSLLTDNLLEVNVNADSSAKYIHRLQEQLIALGYLSGKATSRYDASTEFAVCLYQAANGFPVTGIADAATLTKMFGNSAKAFADCEEIALSFGDQGTKVYALQEALKALGLFEGELTACYGRNTKEAVLAFQKEAALPETGECDINTQIQILKSAQQVKSKNALTGNGILYGLNASGEGVKSLCECLKRYGYLETPGSIYTQAVYEAVKLFQEANRLPASGDTDALTLQTLQGTTAVSYWEYKNQMLTCALSLNDQNYGVTLLQTRLSALGYFKAEISGVYSEETQSAVLLFQRANALTENGVADETLRKLLNTERAVSYEQAFPQMETISLVSLQRAQKVSVYAQSLVGKPYKGGTTGPESYGVGGLTFAVYAEINVTLSPIVSTQLANAQKSVYWRTDFNQAEIGMQMFFLNKNEQKYLTGIYIGEGKTVMASVKDEMVIAVSDLLENDSYEFVGCVCYP